VAHELPGSGRQRPDHSDSLRRRGTRKIVRFRIAEAKLAHDCPIHARHFVHDYLPFGANRFRAFTTKNAKKQ
jgi:hypothetical protein